MANSLDIIPRRIMDEGGVVGRVVLGSHARGTIIFASGLDGSSIEAIDSSTVCPLSQSAQSLMLTL